MLLPSFLAWVEKRYVLACIRVVSIGAIAAALVTVPACQSQIVRGVPSAGRLGDLVVNREHHKLPSLISMAVLTPALSSIAD